MSLEMMASSERVCYVHCNFCNTILAVSVPCSNMYSYATVRCGHCANLLSVNMSGAASVAAATPPQPQLPTTQDFLLQSSQKQQVICSHNEEPHNYNTESGSSSSSKCNKLGSSTVFENQHQHYHHHHQSIEQQQPQMPPIRPPEKRQRVPSAYNRFIKEEIQRIKASNPDISHREAFSAAAKNWAHFPHIRFGLKLDGNNKQAKFHHHDQPFTGDHHHHDKSANRFY